LLSKCALQIKPKPDGTVKLRLITDLLRSHGNEFLLAPERIVLPRLLDAIEMATYLLEGLERAAARGEPGAAEEEVEWGSTDIKDAFLNIPVKPEDRRAQCYKFFGRYYVSDALVFGAGPSPLIWGRMAAWLARTAQGLFDYRELLLQIYVDDPIWAVRGDAATRRHLVVALLLFWQVMGAPFSWGKGQRGASVQWIGAKLTVVNRGPRGRGVTVEVPEDKGADLLRDAEGFLDGRSALARRSLRRFAGQASFIAGLVPLLRPFLSGVWATLKTPVTETGKVPAGGTLEGSEYLVSARRVRHSLRWIRAFLQGTAGAALVREVYLADRRHPGRFTAATDASPWGIGGVLLDGARVVAAFADRVTKADQDRLGIVIGDPAGQALLEGLAILVAVRLFAAQARWNKGRAAALGVKSDSKAALGAAIKLCSKEELLNAIGRELSYDQSVGDYQIWLYEHTPGVANKTPDWLSRLFQPGVREPRPLALTGVRIHTPPAREDGWWRTWNDPPTQPSGPAAPLRGKRARSGQPDREEDGVDRIDASKRGRDAEL